MGTAVTSLGVALVAAGFLVPLERLAGDRTPRTRGLLADLILYAINTTLVLAAVGFLLDAISRALPWRGAPDGLPWAARAAMVLLVGELGAYAGHRAAHAVPILWRLHRLHHDPARALDWAAGHRQHPVEAAWLLLASNLPLALAGFTLADFAVVAAFQRLYTFYLHADLPWSHGALERFVASPRFHRAHHDESAARAGNFAALFPFLDLLFGTKALKA